MLKVIMELTINNKVEQISYEEAKRLNIELNNFFNTGSNIVEKPSPIKTRQELDKEQIALEQQIIKDSVDINEIKTKILSKKCKSNDCGCE